MYSGRTIIKNKSGLHARPAAQFVAEATRHGAKVTIKNLDSGKECNAKSIILILSLSITLGTEVEIEAVGQDEVDAVEDLIALIDSGFDES